MNLEFQYFCENNHHALVWLYLHHPQINPSNDDSYSIRIACQRGYTKIVEYLLADGRANPAVLDNFPLYIAILKDHQDIVKLLIQDPRVTPSAEMFLMAVINHRSEILQFFLSTFRIHPVYPTVLDRAKSMKNRKMLNLLLTDPRIFVYTLRHPEFDLILSRRIKYLLGSDYNPESPLTIRKIFYQHWDRFFDAEPGSLQFLAFRQILRGFQFSK